MEDFNPVVEKILNSKDIAISGHINPDGDSIGSLLSLGLGLENLGKRVYMISADGVPARYRLLPGADRIKREIKTAPDIAVAVDCGNKEMLGSTFKTFQKAGAVLEIDHHEFRRPFGDLGIIDAGAAAVGELIYALLKRLNAHIDKDIAQNLLTSIIVETNSFRLPNVRPVTFNVCAELIEKDVDFYKLVDTVFWSNTRESVILTGICLSRCRFLKNNRLAWSIVTKRDFAKVGGRDEDVDAVADQIRSIRGVKIVVLFRETGKGILRVSLRSKEKINIAQAAEAFGGGGHFDVAGCEIPNNTKSMKKLLNFAGRLL